MGNRLSLRMCCKKSELDESESECLILEDYAEEQVKYGELFVLCNNRSLPHGGHGARRNKYVLFKRDYPSGVKPSLHYMATSSHRSEAALDSTQYSITFSFSRHQAVVVEYTSDENTDMFQIGRSTKPPIDFAVKNVITAKYRGAHTGLQSNTARFACRILADRTNPHVVRIFAAAFDTARNIFLDSKASIWHKSIANIDGLTSYGIFICNPRGVFYGGEATPGLWREVSVGGKIYTVSPSFLGKRRGENMESETNILQDGTLIDTGGAILLWRSAEGLEKSPTEKDLRILVDELNAKEPYCPVEMNQLVIQGGAAPGVIHSVDELQRPYVYLRCGHVQGLHKWDLGKYSSTRSCPLCRLSGPVVQLRMGMEPAFYVDCGPLTFAFKPCGHMASERTVKYWADVPYSHRAGGQVGVCPFCASVLDGSPGYVQLFFQTAQE